MSGSAEDAAKQLQALYDVFVQSDCTMLEVNPLAETDDEAPRRRGRQAQL